MGSFEWSGELLTREEGNINDLDDWKIIAEDMYLADIGTYGGTEYEVNRGAFKSSDIIELYEKYPELEDGVLKLQHIHTHHCFQTFFSGTDWENLEDRAMASNYFLMLIVNFAGVFKAKVAFKATVEGGKAVKLAFANNEDGYKPLTLSGKEDKEMLVVMDCKIEVEEMTDVPKDFEDRYDAVRKAIDDEKKKEDEERRSKYSKNFAPGVRKQGQLPFKTGGNHTPEWFPNEHWDSDAPENTYNPDGNWKDEYEYVGGVWKKIEKKEKKITEMTEKEFQQWEELEAAEKVFMQDQQGQGEETTFNERTARAFLNCILTDTYSMDNFKDLKAPLLKENKALETKEELADWLEGFQLALQESFDIIYYPNTIIQYIALMNECSAYLEQYKSNRLVAGMIEIIAEELEMVEGGEPVEEAEILK